MRIDPPRLQVISAALLFSTGGAAIKTGAFTAAQVSCLRSAIAAIALVVWLGRRVSWSPMLIAVAVPYAATLILFVASTKLTTAANAIFLQSTAPFYVLLLGPFVLGERFAWRNVAYLALIGVGLVFCVIGQPASTATAPDPFTGTVLGVVCSVTWAFTLLTLRSAQRGRSEDDVGLSAVVAGNSIAALVAFPFAWPLPPAPLVEWATLAYLGVFQVGLAYVFLTAAMRRLPAVDVSLLLLIEPVFNPIWTWLVRGEQPGTWVIVGGVLIVAATAIATKHTNNGNLPQRAQRSPR